MDVQNVVHAFARTTLMDIAAVRRKRMTELLAKYVEELKGDIYKTRTPSDRIGLNELVDQCYIRVLKDELKQAKSGVVDDFCNFTWTWKENKCSCCKVGGTE